MSEEELKGVADVFKERFPNLAVWRDRLKRAPGWSGEVYAVIPGERIARRR